MRLDKTEYQVCLVMLVMLVLLVIGDILGLKGRVEPRAQTVIRVLLEEKDYPVTREILDPPE